MSDTAPGKVYVLMLGATILGVYSTPAKAQQQANRFGARLRPKIHQVLVDRPA